MYHHTDSSEFRQRLATHLNFPLVQVIRIVSKVLCMDLRIKAGDRGGGGQGGKIPGTRSAQRGPEISVKCSYCLSSLYVCRK